LPKEPAVGTVDLPPPLLSGVSAGKEQVDIRTEEQERSPPQRVWRVVPVTKDPRAPAWVVGSLVHEALADWRFPGSVHFEPWVRARARSYGITDALQLTHAVTRTGRLLRRFQGHALCLAMNGATRRLHEVPYSIEIDGQVESGIIDALFLDEGAWKVVEFKTNYLRGLEDKARLLQKENYVEQAKRYRRAVEQLLGVSPTVILCLLDYAGSIYLEYLG
jgi:ATP-dependent exoDNAse (exonuclease V) beta subunit